MNKILIAIALTLLAGIPLSLAQETIPEFEEQASAAPF